MAKYNIIKNSFLTSTTFSGGGNKTLSQVELGMLFDDSITTVATTVSLSDILYIDVDMGTRLKIDNIYLYADDLTKLAHINFFSKNYEEDDFAICSKDMSTTAYIGTVPNPYAPRYIRCTISGVSLSLYELQILNNDAAVGFGQDGYSNETFILDAPEGEFGDVQTIDIYNNGTNDYPVNAYICIDYTGTVDDEYIEIASSIEGPFLNIKNTALNNIWDYGLFDNTLKGYINEKEILKLSISDHINDDSPQYIGSLPDLTCTYPTKPCGISRYTTYDHVNKRIYVVFWSGPDMVNSAVKLYYYDIQNNSWVFRGNLINGDWYASRITICCDSSKVYFFTGSVSSYRYIYEHSLIGALGNITLKHTLVTGIYITYDAVMVCDFNGYIYIRINYHSSVGPHTTYFAKISTSTWIASNLAVGGYNVPDGYGAPYLTYDYTNNIIYYIYTTTSYTNDYYISRYSVVNDSWVIKFFSYGNKIMANNQNLSFYCYNQDLFFISYAYGAKMYRYSPNTDTLVSIDIGINTNTVIENGFIVTEPFHTDYDASVFIFGGSVEMPYTLYGYNVPACFKYSPEFELPISGTFTTSVFYLEDRNYSSYFKIKSSSILGLTSISYDENLYDGLIEVRSSDIPPIPIDNIFWPVQVLAHTNLTLIKYNINTNYTSSISYPPVGSYVGGYLSYVSNNTGKFLIIQMSIYSYYTHHAHIFKSNGELIRTFIADSGGYETLNRSIGLDISEGIWFLNNDNNLLKHFNKENVLIGSKLVVGFYCMSPCLSSNGLWYVNRTSKTLIKVNEYITTIVTIYLLDPYEVCCNSDDSCWVIDNGDPDYGNTIKKYSSLGTLEKIIKVSSNFLIITSDFKDGFYAFSTNDTPQEVHHFDSNGNNTMSVSNLAGDDNIRGGINGVVLYSSVLKRLRYINKKTASIVWTKFYTDIFDQSNYMNTGDPIIFSFGIEEQNKYFDVPRLLPQSSDENWDFSTGLLPWKVVSKDGYFLPKVRYHQVRLTLRNFDGLSTPYVYEIVMAPAVIITDIPQYESKPLFIRTNIPAGTELTQLNTRIKVWWDTFSS